ncbi:hypothetical protein KP509_16G028400 [Ceratopteris richardii]|uniref:Uncharacterized protein n=1 Tax=Ceratopteris richardii TaxID=49495 RepID=A0A8T2T367_CERRI|nr:hypothetical protein KP509_16G028400 [Ceratopteris richardii]
MREFISSLEDCRCNVVFLGDDKSLIILNILRIFSNGISMASHVMRSRTKFGKLSGDKRVDQYDKHLISEQPCIKDSAPPIERFCGEFLSVFHYCTDSLRFEM